MRRIGDVLPKREYVELPPARPTVDAEGRRMSIFDPFRAATCQTCLDVGWVRRDGLDVKHALFGKAIPCDTCSTNQVVSAEIGVLMRQARIPEHLHGHTLETWRARFHMRPGIYKAAVSFSVTGLTKDGRHGLYLHGPTGTGKTGLAVAILADMLPRAEGRRRYIVWSEFLDSIRASWTTSTSLTVGEAVAEYANSRLLVIDEFGGSGTGSGDPSWRADIARRLADARYAGASRGCLTIWTSNLDMEGIAREFGGDPIGDAIASRIAGHCTLVHMSGDDARVGGA